MLKKTCFEACYVIRGSFQDNLIIAGNPPKIVKENLM